MNMEFKLPILGEKIDSGDVVAIKVKEGDSVAKDQTLLELETDKAVIEIPSPVAGTVKSIHVKMGDKARVGQLMFTFDGQDAKEPAPQKPATPKPAPVAPAPVAPSPQPKPPMPDFPMTAAPVPAQSPGDLETVMASPAVRLLAREMGVDLSRLSGTGQNGRITQEDVKGFVKQEMDHPEVKSSAAVTSNSVSLPDFSKWGEVEIKPLTAVRRATAKAMALAWSQIPQVTQFDNADITQVLDLRRRFSSRVEASGGKLTVTAIILKTVGAALKVFPQFNTSIDMASEEAIYKKYIHVGVAVDTERGLLVPVIRQVDKKNIVELSVELNRLAEKARTKKITPDELEGGTFTITNLGSIGTTHFTPIVNWPQVAILGVGRSEERPIMRAGSWESRMILPLSLTYDHRMIDGADAARFLRWIAEAVQEPFLLDLEG